MFDHGKLATPAREMGNIWIAPNTVRAGSTPKKGEHFDWVAVRARGARHDTTHFKDVEVMHARLVFSCELSSGAGLQPQHWSGVFGFMLRRVGKKIAGSDLFELTEEASIRGIKDVLFAACMIPYRDRPRKFILPHTF